MLTGNDFHLVPVKEQSWEGGGVWCLQTKESIHTSLHRHQLLPEGSPWKQVYVASENGTLRGEGRGNLFFTSHPLILCEPSVRSHLPGCKPGWLWGRWLGAPWTPRTHHVLHAYADLAVAIEGPVEAHDVRRVALVQHLQLADDLVPDGWLDLQVNQLKGDRDQVQEQSQEGAGLQLSALEVLTAAFETSSNPLLNTHIHAHSCTHISTAA